MYTPVTEDGKIFCLMANRLIIVHSSEEICNFFSQFTLREGGITDSYDVTGNLSIVSLGALFRFVGRDDELDQLKTLLLQLWRYRSSSLLVRTYVRKVEEIHTGLENYAPIRSSKAGWVCILCTWRREWHR